MRLKQALIDLGYKHPDLRPHLRKILARTLSEDVLNEVRRLEDGRTNDPRQWEAVYELLLDANPKMPLVRQALERITKIRGRMRDSPRRLPWGMGGFAQMIADQEVPFRRFPSTVVKKSGNLMKLLKFQDGTYLVMVDKMVEPEMAPYSSEKSAMEGFRRIEAERSGHGYDQGFDEDDLLHLYDPDPEPGQPTQEELDYLDSLEPDWL